MALYSHKGKTNNEAPARLPEKKGDKEWVNHPDHYNDTSIETIEMFLLIYHDRPEIIKGALIFNIFKYRDRLGKKDSPGDAEKMEWYLDKFELLFPEDYHLLKIYRQYKDIN